MDTAPKANQVAYTINPNGIIGLRAKIVMPKRFIGRNVLSCGVIDQSGGADADTEAFGAWGKRLP